MFELEMSTWDDGKEVNVEKLFERHCLKINVLK